MAEDRPKRPRKKKEAGAEEAAAAKGGGAKTIIIAAGVAALMLGLGLGVGFFVGGMVSPAEQVADGASADGEDAGEEPEEPAEVRHNIYADVGKLLVEVDDQGKRRYIQAEIQLAAYEREVIDEINADMPAVKSRLLLLYGSQNVEALRSEEGKKQLLQATAEAVNEVLGITMENGVHEAFFSGFVIQ